MRKIFFLSLLLCFLSISYDAGAQGDYVVKNQQSEISLLIGEYNASYAQIGLLVKMEPKWHIYWRNPGDTGFPLTLNLGNSKNINGIEFSWPAPELLREEGAPGSYLESYIYKDQVLFPIKITPKEKGQVIEISANISYAICAEICIPAQTNIKAIVNPGYMNKAALLQINNVQKTIPQENGYNGLKINNINKYDIGDKSFLEVNVSANKISENAEVFIEAGQGFSFVNQKLEINGGIGKFILDINSINKGGDVKSTQLKITFVNDGAAVEKDIKGDEIGVVMPPGENATISNGYNILLMLVFAFVGGLILNVMPCVLPVLSIKLLSVIKYSSGNKSEITKAFLVTALGVLTSFVIFAVITIFLKQAGEVVGWGLHFQQPYFIISLVIILTLFAASLWGLFDINLPFSLNNNQLGGVIEHFLTGVLVTVLATPCTAPFLGAAVGFAVTRPAFEIIIIFVAMGLGLAVPYILLAANPGFISILPKPGSWMLTVKKIMGCLLAIAAIWLIWVLSNQLGMLAGIILFILSVIKVIKLWGAKHYNIINKIKIPALVVMVFLSFFLPLKVSHKSEFNIAELEIWEDFHPEHISQLVANGKIVFVDVTADWCLTCKVNKLTTLDSDEIKELFVNDNIIAMRANWTNRNPEIASYLMLHKRAGIPFNIVYGPKYPDGIVLPELLTKSIVKEAVRKVK